MNDMGCIYEEGPAGTLSEGRYLPVPKSCPECGASTQRTGNRHKRRVWCTGFPKCRWSKTVYRESVKAFAG